MRRLRHTSEESLDLLLDTLCNVFGGIILISCLLALLTHKQPPAAPGPGAEVKDRLLAERLDAARQELSGMQALLQKQQVGGAGDLNQLLTERDQLSATLKDLRRHAVTAPVDDHSSTDPTGAIVQLRAEVRALDLQIADANARTQAAKIREKDLATRLQKLKNEATQNENKQVEHIRFPKERQTTRLNANIILKFGEFFPLNIDNGKHFPGVLRDPPDKDTYKAIPRQGQGWKLPQDSKKIASALAEYKVEGRYLAIYIYPDSFETFRSLKGLIYDVNVEYGFEILPADYIIQFVPNGNSPAPL